MQRSKYEIGRKMTWGDRTNEAETELKHTDSGPVGVENEIQLQPSLMTHQTCRGKRPVYEGDKGHSPMTMSVWLMFTLPKPLVALQT